VIRKKIGIKISIVIFSLSLLISAGYILTPKTITSCSQVSDGEVCSTITCVGVPYHSMTVPSSPKCLGNSEILNR
jgi:hypothetical protein